MAILLQRGGLSSRRPGGPLRLDGGGTRGSGRPPLAGFVYAVPLGLAIWALIGGTIAIL